MKFIKNTDCNYSYIVDNKRMNRYKFRKDELVKIGYSKDKTEKDIMFDLNMFRVYDAGSIKYEILL